MNNTDNTSNEETPDLTICGGEHDVVELMSSRNWNPETTYREKPVRGEE